MHTWSGGGGGAAGCSPHQREILKNTDFVDTMI